MVKSGGANLPKKVYDQMLKSFGAPLKSERAAAP